jgi:alkylation response protein AidB-like acyl-CoA dehydrogenase
MASSNGPAKGGAFIIPDGYGIPVETTSFVPEDFTEEQRSVRDMVRDFAEAELSDGTIRRMDRKEDEFAEVRRLMKQAAELGLTGIDIPEEYGGLGLDMVTYMLVSEILGVGGSWAVSWAANVGIGTSPLAFFGTPEQKERYLSKITSGEWITAFAATEPGAGSDLVSISTKATLDGDAYVLNGEKTFITNAAFADLFTVLVKIDGDPKKSACLLVEKTYPGVRPGKEEHKLGIQGSSTCPVVFDNVRVPKENLVGAVGQGMHIMLNALNLGRLKLALMCVGPSKRGITGVVRHTLARKQFGVPIAHFGMSQEKFAEMISRTWMVESASYRASGLLSERMEHADPADPNAAMEALREYTIEAALLKVAGSELLWDISDHCVQLLGGYGYSTEYPAERYLRDSRINRIFEGTNEINRLAGILTLFEKAAKNEIPLMAVVPQIVAEMRKGTEKKSGSSGIPRLAKKMKKMLLLTVELARKKYGAGKTSEKAEEKPAANFPQEQSALVNNMKKMFLFTAGLVYQKYGNDKMALMKSQEVLQRLSDMLILIYVSESGLLRATRIGGEIPAAISTMYIQKSFLKLETMAKEVLASLETGTMREMYLGGLRQLSRIRLVDTIGLGRTIVAPLLKEGEYYL